MSTPKFLKLDVWDIVVGAIFIAPPLLWAFHYFSSPQPRLAALSETVDAIVTQTATITNRSCPGVGDCTPQYVGGKVLVVNAIGSENGVRYSLNTAVQKQLSPDLAPAPGDSISTVVFVEPLPMQHATADYEEPINRKHRRTVDFNVYPVNATFINLQERTFIGKKKFTPVPPHVLGSSRDLHADGDMFAFINCLRRKAGTLFAEEPLGCALPMESR